MVTPLLTYRPERGRKTMCETCYVGDKLNGLLTTEDPLSVKMAVMGSHFRAAESGLGRELQ